MFRTFSAAVSCCDFSSLKLGSVFPIHSETARLWKGQNCQNIYSLSADSAFCKRTKACVILNNVNHNNNYYWLFYISRFTNKQKYVFTRKINTLQGRIMFVGDYSGDTMITTTIIIIKIIIMIIIIQVTQYFLNCTPFNYVSFQLSIKGWLLQWQTI